MYIRKKKNRSGSITVVAVSKARGFYEEVRNFGTTESDDDVSSLYAEAVHWLNTHGNQLPLDFDDERGREREETARVVDNMDAVLLNRHPADKVLDIAKTITTIRVNMPQNHDIYTKTLFLSDEQNTVKPLFDLSTLGVE